MHASRRNNQRGAAHLLLIVFVTLIVGVIGFVGYAIVQHNQANAGDTMTLANALLRSDVVAKTQQQYQLWQNGTLRPGTSFYGYTQGHNELWCADFISWIYATQHRPVTGSATYWRNNNVPSIQHAAVMGYNGFHFHNPGRYTPVPGDLALYADDGYTYGHINIVVSVSGGLMTVIGGDQGGLPSYARPAGVPYQQTSKVSRYANIPISGYSGISGLTVTGFVSPDAF